MKKWTNYIWKVWLRRREIKLSKGPASLSKGSTLLLEAPASIGDVKVVARELKIGAYTYMRSGELQMVNSIGRFCSIGQNVFIGQDPHGHPLDWLSTHPFQYQGDFPESRPALNYVSGWENTEIGNDVWIGEDVIIMKGVKVGHGAVLAARSIVTQDVPPYAIVAGMPARLVRYRFPPEVIESLLATRWWELPVSRLHELPLDKPETCTRELESWRERQVNPAAYPTVRISRSGCQVV